MLKLLKFAAPWCGNCKALGPIIDEIVSETNIELQVVDCDKEVDLCTKYDIMNLPTVILLKDNDVVYRATGLLSKQILLDNIKSFM